MTRTHAEGISGFVLNSRQLNCILLNLLGKSHEEEQNKVCSHVYPPNRPGKIQAYKLLNTFFFITGGLERGKSSHHSATSQSVSQVGYLHSK